MTGKAFLALIGAIVVGIAIGGALARMRLAAADRPMESAAGARATEQVAPPASTTTAPAAATATEQPEQPAAEASPSPAREGAADLEATTEATAETAPVDSAPTVVRPTDQPASAPPAGTRQNLSLVGALRLNPFNRGVHGDVAAYKNLAFVGKGRGSCPGTGVDIVDISDPAAPEKIADTDDYEDTAMEDMAALRIGERDILAIGLQECGGDDEAGTTALELVDITDPRQPRRLSLFPTGGPGVHEMSVTVTPAGRTLALLAVPELETETAGEDGKGGTGDLIIVDISDPANPTQVAEWGILDEPALGLDAYQDAQLGGDPRALLHSVRGSADGTRAYLSYWDAGVILLDISDPARPVYLGRTAYAAGEDGDAHSVAEAQDGQILVEAAEDLSPYGLTIASPAFPASRPASQADFAARITSLPQNRLANEVVFVGRGCPAGAPVDDSPEDPYRADAAGKIALIERGSCPFDTKIARAQQEGAVGAIIFDPDGPSNMLIKMGGERDVTLRDGDVTITIPAIFVGSETGAALRDAPAPVDVTVASEFNGWGGLRLFSLQDPAKPTLLGTFATSNTVDERAASRGMWSVHNPEVVGTTMYASWYNDGVRVVDITDPAAPREIASWTGEGAPAGAPPVVIWSVVPHGDILLASDLNFGLYILRLEP